MTQDPDLYRSSSKPVRGCLTATGIAFTLLALVGVFLPVLPTTPFLLIAAACFARSSKPFHQALLANRYFGPYIDQWERERTIPKDAKRKAYVLIAVSFTLSILIVRAPLLRLLLGGIAIALVLFLRSLPSGLRQTGFRDDP